MKKARKPESTKARTAKAATAVAVDPRIALIDELGRLDLELAVVKPKQNRVKALKAIIAAWADDLPAEQATIFDGQEYSAQVSACEEERAIEDMEAVFDFLGKELFLKLCTMTLKNLEANLNPAQVAQVLKVGRTGSRSVKPLKRAAIAA